MSNMLNSNDDSTVVVICSCLYEPRANDSGLHCVTTYIACSLFVCSNCIARRMQLALFASRRARLVEGVFERGASGVERVVEKVFRYSLLHAKY